MVFAESQEVAQNNRIRVQGRSNMTLIPDFFIVDIFNLSDEDLSHINDSKRLVVMMNDFTIVCSGEIDGIYKHSDGSNDIYSISIVDGRSFWEEKVNKTLVGGTWMNDAVRKILKSADYGVFMCEDYRMPRGQVFCGRLADSISTIAKGLKARAFIVNNVLSIIEKGRSVTTETLNDSEIITEPNKENGVVIVKTYARILIVGGIVIYDGIQYRVITQAFNLDNMSGSWDTESTLINENEFERMEGGW